MQKAVLLCKIRQVFVAAFSKRKQICPSGSSNPAHTAAGDPAVVDGGDFRHANKFRSTSSSCTTIRIQYSEFQTPDQSE